MAFVLFQEAGAWSELLKGWCPLLRADDSRVDVMPNRDPMILLFGS